MIETGDGLFSTCHIFYKHHELSLRLVFFWTASALADVLGGFLAFGLLHLRGVEGQADWRWPFLIEVQPPDIQREQTIDN